MEKKATQRLALFLPSLRGGGAERVMVILANGFAQQGHAVDLVLAKAEGHCLKDVCSQVRVVDLKAQRVLTCLPTLVRYLRRERPQAMLSALSHANVVAIWARTLARVHTRLVVSEHSTLSAAHASPTAIRSRLLPTLMRRTYPNASAIVTVSMGVADDLAQALDLPRQTVTVIYNPAVTPRVLALAREQPEHPWLNDGGPPVILAAGRLTPAKDYHTLLRAFARLQEQQSVRLIILGEGEDRADLEALTRQLGIADAVDMPGFKDNPYAYMRAAALFVLSSRWEGLGNVLIEAMACGTPVVATNCPSGPDEILENGKWGQLVPVGNIEILASVMGATLNASQHQDTASRAAAFSERRAVDRYLDVMLP